MGSEEVCHRDNICQLALRRSESDEVPAEFTYSPPGVPRWGTPPPCPNSSGRASRSLSPTPAGLGVPRGGTPPPPSCSGRASSNGSPGLALFGGPRGGNPSQRSGSGRASRSASPAPGPLGAPRGVNPPPPSSSECASGNGSGSRAPAGDGVFKRGTPPHPTGSSHTSGSNPPSAAGGALLDQHPSMPQLGSIEGQISGANRGTTGVVRASAAAPALPPEHVGHASSGGVSAEDVAGRLALLRCGPV